MLAVKCIQLLIFCHLSHVESNQNELILNSVNINCIILGNWCRYPALPAAAAATTAVAVGNLVFVLCICSIAGKGISEQVCEKLASAVKDIISNIRELELSGDILKDSLCSVLSVGLSQPKLEKLK